MSSLGQSLMKEWIGVFFPGKEVIENYRPDWLEGLEIDIYIPEYKLGFEFQGIQHYCSTHRISEDQVAKQVGRDNKKNYLAKQNKVALVIVTTFLMRKEKLMRSVFSRARSLLKFYTKRELILPKAMEYKFEVSQDKVDDLVKRCKKYYYSLLSTDPATTKPPKKLFKTLEIIEVNSDLYDWYLKNNPYMDYETFARKVRFEPAWREGLLNNKNKTKIQNLQGKNVNRNQISTAQQIAARKAATRQLYR